MAVAENIPPLIREKLDVIESLCREHHVTRLDVFGSAVSDRFDPRESDLDFVVEFDDSKRAWGLQGDYLTLLIELEAAFGRHVDLVEYQAVKNPYFLEELDEKRAPVLDGS